MAEPTEPSAALCFADLMLDVAISAPRKSLCFFSDYTTMLQRSQRRAAARVRQSHGHAAS